MLSLTASSQIDTSKITLKVPVARKVVVELLQCDSIKCELQSTQTILHLTEEKVCIYDSLVATYKQKEVLYKAEISADEAKETVYKKAVDKLEKANVKLVKTAKILGAGLAASVVSIITLILVK